MKFTISTNGKFNDVKINKTTNGEIHSIEIDFTPPYSWSDLEFWLHDSETDKFLDYARMNLTVRNKMKFSK
jgi:hypothetical protein